MNMKEIKNRTRQQKCLLLKENYKPKEIVLGSLESIVIPESWMTCQTSNMAQMQLITISDYNS